MELKHKMSNEQRLEIISVDKFNANWASETLFSGFMIRAILKEQEDIITKLEAVSRLKKRLKREMGEEGTDWILIQNDKTDEDELYLLNSGKLVLWKLQDHVKFNELFQRVESHRDMNEI
jgi:hypothetical protein